MRHRKKFGTILIIFGVTVGMILLFNSLRQETAKSSGLDKEIERLRKEAGDLESRNSALIDLTKELSEVEFLESEARIKMGLKMPGEEVVVINRATSTGIQEPASAGLRRGEDRSIWENPGRWYEYFFNKR